MDKNDLNFRIPCTSLIPGIFSIGLYKDLFSIQKPLNFGDFLVSF